MTPALALALALPAAATLRVSPLSPGGLGHPPVALPSVTLDSFEPLVGLPPLAAAPELPGGAPLAAVPAAAAAQLTPELFTVIERTALDFMRRYPPSEYVYVGLGRSPHAILGYIDATGAGDVTYVPMSNGKWHFEDPDGRSLRTPERERALKGHFRRFLPDERRLAGRKALVVDFCDNCSGLMVGMYYTIEAYFEDGFDLSRIRGVGLHKSRPSSGFYWRTREMKEEVEVHVDAYSTFEAASDGEPSLFGAMMYGKEDDWLEAHAPVGRFDLRTLEKGDDYAERRPQYELFLDWLRRTASARRP